MMTQRLTNREQGNVGHTESVEEEVLLLILPSPLEEDKRELLEDTKEL